jgi:hypothetical protein
MNSIVAPNGRTPSHHYTPAEDEPSIFGVNVGQPGSEWMLWYSRKAETSILKAFEYGSRIIESLMAEAPRPVGDLGDEPAMSIYQEEFKKAGIKRRVLSFRWVIYAKYRRDLDWLETHADGQLMLSREVAL